MRPIALLAALPLAAPAAARDPVAGREPDDPATEAAVAVAPPAAARVRVLGGAA